MANARNPGAGRLLRGRQLRVFPKALVTMTYEGDVAAKLRELERRILSKVLRPAAYAGAKVLYMDMLMRAPIETGTLVGSIFHWYDRKRSTAVKKEYLIGPNKAQAPHWYNVEFGHWRYNQSAGGVVWRRSKTNPSGRVAGSTPSGPGGNYRSVHNRPGALDVPVWVPASPYIRPTWDGQKLNALAAAKKRAGEKLREVMGEVART
jgi:hypothetical protein